MKLEIHIMGMSVRVVRPRSFAHNMVNHITAEEAEIITDWCHDNKCGRRTSFNHFNFHNDKELTMFLLKWS